MYSRYYFLSSISGNVDYTPLNSEERTFTPDNIGSAQCVDVVTVEDSIVENAMEMFSVSISSEDPSAAFTNSTASVTILEDDDGKLNHCLLK